METTDWVEIPGFKKYQVNKTTNEVRNAETERVLVQKKGTGVYYLENDEQMRKLIGIKEICSLCQIDEKVKGAAKEAVTKLNEKKATETGNNSDTTAVEGKQSETKQVKMKTTATTKSKKNAAKKTTKKAATPAKKAGSKKASPAKATRKKKAKRTEAKKQVIERSIDDVIAIVGHSGDHDISKTNAKKVQTILAREESKDAKIKRIYDLELELPNKIIGELCDSSAGNVSRALWMYNEGHRVLND